MGKKKTAAKVTKFLSADDIFAAEDLKREPVHVPEWDGDVIVATMSGSQRDAFELSLPEGKTVQERMQNLRARIVAACCINEDGSPLFTLNQVEQLGRKSGKALGRVANVAKRLNGMTGEDGPTKN